MFRLLNFAEYPPEISSSMLFAVEVGQCCLASPRFLYELDWSLGHSSWAKSGV